MQLIKTTSRLIVLVPLCLMYSCGPKIFFFHALPCTTITKNDSIQFTWKVRGTPILLHWQEDAEDPDNPGKHYEYYKLVAKKGKKDSANPMLGLTVLPDTSVDYILINTIHRGDSAVALATRDTLVWGKHFMLDRISSGSGRELTVTHNGRTAKLDATGGLSTAFKGLPNSGPWELSTLLTEAERKDTSRIPGRLMIKTIIIHP